MQAWRVNSVCPVFRFRSAGPSVVLAAAVVAACGGADPAPADSAVQAAQAAAAAAAARAAAADTGSADGSVGIVREVFTYVGSARDPFRSLMMDDAGLRPFVEDLRVTSIIFDARYPARSVAVLRDVTAGEAYQVRAGDIVGRLLVTEVREYEVVISVENFGQSRQVVIPVRRRQEGDS